jgi:hypothetical protein
VADPADDLMFAYARAGSDGVLLDPGHDDYWGPPGDNHLPAGCPASANVANSLWLTSHPFFRLTVRSGSDGSTSVRQEGGASDDCAPECVVDVEAGTRFDIAAEPDSGYHFAGWSGVDCPEVECSVILSASMTVSASFEPDPVLALSFRGKGRVAAPAVGSACATSCSVQLPYAVSTLFRATPAKGWRFTGWKGACRGARPTCRVSLTADANATASFARASLARCARGTRSTAKHPCRV